ncbi:hypothetical protein RchiOBHm_Chr6g0277451 [Rosa chinensis]|uniref:Uncharacterized protein n=1 Tax=Rosa chinensis TaxID=74649 RepID=A0A2P6PSG5_ROSCH|nr:hypothetical protein RchiOBHm_Chr6g0277451 [Rosa chinensis]
MENHGSAKLNRTTSLDSEPKTLTKGQYDLARAAAALHAFEQRNNETTGISKPEENPISSLMKDQVGTKSCGVKFPA